ncbi:Uncharacterized protein Fot_52691 [Forsythia ovata]|uniref:Uncharacterized protein n=1 Tax=Forsythia ovata TaxID=205694 RepID=A0ABD1PLG7_9LAMI
MSKDQGWKVNHSNGSYCWDPAAIGAMLLLRKKIQTKGILRPIDPEIYVPGGGNGKWEVQQSHEAHSENGVEQGWGEMVKDRGRKENPLPDKLSGGSGVYKGWIGGGRSGQE